MCACVRDAGCVCMQGQTFNKYVVRVGVMGQMEPIQKDETYGQDGCWGV